MKLFAVYDRKSKTYDRMIFLKTIAEAIRAFETAIREPDSMWSKYKEDFEFHHIADMNLETGFLEHFGSVVAVGSDYLKDTHQYNLPLEDQKNND